MPYKKPNLQPNQFAVYAISRMKNTTFEANRQLDGNGNEVINTLEPKIKSEYINAYIPITFFDGEQSSYFSIYDENLQIKENSQYSFTFSVAKFLNGELNPIFYLLVENRRLRLQTFYQKIDFIITSITPQITNQNIIYQVTCQDVFSYDLSKQNITITYQPEVPYDIRTLADNIVSLSKMETRWKVDASLEAGYYADFPALQQVNAGTTRTPYKMKATIDISGSTPYNALVELAKKFNANITVEYSDDENKPGTIYFHNKLLDSFQGYMLRPDVNMSAFSVSRKTDNFCSVMHVSGGEDADGNIVSMVPTIPNDVQTYFTMLYPHRTDKPHEIFKTSSYDYVVIETSDGKYNRYQKLGSTYVFEKADYKPWTLMTAEEIRADFNSFTFANGVGFESAQSNEVNDYFNFLSYRAKTGASLFYDFQYYMNAGLMDEATYRDIEDVFSRRLRNANIILFCVTYQYNILSMNLQRYEDIEEEYFAQLAANEEERYLYETNQLEQPESVLDVMGASEDQAGTLDRTTIMNIIDNEKMSILNKLHTEVWVDDYYKLLFTLRGASALEDKIAELASGGLSTQESKFSSNFASAMALLDTKAPQGVITFTLATVPSATDIVESTLITTTLDVPVTIQSNGVDYRVQYAAYVKDPAGPKFNLYLSTSANGQITYGKQNVLMATYTNAVINTELDGSSGTGSFGEHEGTSYAKLEVTPIDDRDNEYSTFTLSFYYNRNEDSCTVDVFKPKICTSRADRETYLSNGEPATYSNYAVYKKRYTDALNYIKEYPSKTDLSNPNTTPVRRGIYQLQYDYWTDAINKQTTDPYRYYAAKAKYSTPYNLLEWLTDARKEQSDIWQEIYTNYGDFIAETTFTDSDQISSEGLFMAAMQSFSKYNSPTYEYSTTVISTKAISNIQDKDVAIGDIVYVYNKDVSSQYANKLRITIPRDKIGKFYKLGDDKMYYGTKVPETASSTWNVTKNTLELMRAVCKLYCSKQADDRYYYQYGEGTGEGVYLAPASLTDMPALKVVGVENHGNYVDIIVECSITQATGILSSKASIDTLTLYPMNGADYVDSEMNSIVHTGVIDIQMEENVKPIPLQITGVTRKLREETSQLTVSTDRTMDLVFNRLIKQARL